MTGCVVRGDTNLPASGAEVNIPGTPFQTRADDQGLFRLEGVRSGVVRLHGALPGLSASMEYQLQSGKETSIRLVLTGDADITGCVVSGFDKTPIAEALLTIAQTQISGKSDAEGRFTLSGIPVGQVTLQVAAKNYLPRDMVIDLTNGQQKLDDVALTPTTSVSGVVMRTLDGQPIQDAAVVIVGCDLKCQTGPTGEFTISGVPAGQQTIQLAASGFVAQQLEQNLTPGEHRIKEVSLVGDTDLRAVVLSINGDGQKLAVLGASIEVSTSGYRTTLTSAENGEFTIGKIPSGQVDVMAKAEGFRDAHMTALANPTNASIEILLVPLIIVRGVVVEAGNRRIPVANASVQVRVDGYEQQVKSDSGRWIHAACSGRSGGG